MRVALIDPSLFTLPYDRRLAQGLEQEGHQVTLYSRRPGADDNESGDVTLVSAFYRVAGHPAVSRLPGPVRLGLKGLDHWVSMVRLRRILVREAPDVIHFQWLPLPVLDLRFLAGLHAIAPLVLTLHDTQPFNGNPSARLQRIGVEDAIERFDRVIVHTEQGRERMVSLGLAADTVACLPHGLLEDVVPAPADPMDSPVTFLLIGKIKPYKGLDVLLEAFARLPAAQRTQARLRVVGKPYMDMAPLLTRAEALGISDRLEFDGRFVADAAFAELMAVPGTVAVFPYREIEASGVLGLAVGSGRPILASALGSFSETLVDGLHGRLLPPGDVDALAAGMREMIEDRGFASRCAAAVQALAGRVAGWNEIARSTVQVYEAAAQHAAKTGSHPPAGRNRAVPRRVA
ncbi:MAG: glycosyltransferase [Janthinobacterium lividum]